MEEANKYLTEIFVPKFNSKLAMNYKNKYYQPYLNCELMCFMLKTEFLIINAFNGDSLVSIDDKIYEL